MDFKTLRALAASRLPAVERRALVAIAMHLGADGTCFPSLATLGKEAALSKSALCRALGSLEARGIITRRHGGGRAATTYALDCDAALSWEPPDTERVTSCPTVAQQLSQGDTAAVPQEDSCCPTVAQQLSQGGTLRAIEGLMEENIQEHLQEREQVAPESLPAWVTAALPPAPAAPEDVTAQVSLPLVASAPVEAPPVEETPKGKRKGGAPPTLTADEAAAWEAAEGARASQAVRLRARPYPPPWELAAIRRRLAAGWTVDDFGVVARWFWSPEEAGRRATSDPASTYWRECHDGAYLEAAHRALTQPRIPPVQAARIAWAMYREAVGWARDELPAALGEAIEARLGYEVAEAVYDAHKVLAWKLRRAPGESERREVAAEWGQDVTARIENAWSVVDRARAAR